MSAIQFELEADVRTDKDMGRGASRRLRRIERVPAVVYGAGEQAVSLLLDHHKLVKALSFEAFYSRILTLKVGKKTEKVILKALQRHPSKPRLLHLDFLRVRADQKLEMHIPLHFKGAEEAPGLKEGAVFAHLMSDIEVSCLPGDLPEYIEVDVSQMGLDQSIYLSDLKLPKGVELTAFAQGTEGHDQQIVSLHIPRVEEEIVEAAAPAASDVPTVGEEESKSEDSAKDKEK